MSAAQQASRQFMAAAERLTTLYSLSDRWNRILDLLETVEENPEHTA